MASDDLNSRFVSNEIWATSKPNWSEWTGRNKCQLWEAIALACDVDPAIYRPDGPATSVAVDALFAPVPQSMRNLIEYARGAIGSHVLTFSRQKFCAPLNNEVNLGEFRNWLLMIGHPMPMGFPKVASELLPRNLLWPWGSYQTKDLRFLALAADKFWKNYDPDDISTAPKSEDVADWLIERKVPRRKAEAMASMLRADDLPVGRRSKDDLE